ncbi:MAG TPA: PDZ domain-containing protein, partial [Vicinamibacterales bacterium]|nr:PDZ domain-containing protein [Vicinamibacterales bacterium]
AHWLVIDRLTRSSGEPLSDLKDLNDVVVGVERNFGVRTDGMRITSVQAGSNASTFGLRAGDLVASVNGRALPAGLDLIDYLDLVDPDQPLTMTVARGEHQIELTGTYQPTPSAKITPLFPRHGQAGRVDLVRDGNTVRLTTRGVAELTLLISPDAFDFTRPVTVLADGKTVFDARVTPTVATLMKWAATDNDRTMLFGAEVHLKLAQ